MLLTLLTLLILLRSFFARSGGVPDLRYLLYLLYLFYLREWLPEFIKLVWKEIRHSVTNPRPPLYYLLHRRPSLLHSKLKIM
jgi:hypothetical protein